MRAAPPRITLQRWRVAGSRSSVPAALAILVLLSLLCPVPARSQFSVLETHDLRLIYLETSHGYLAPHVARCFENSLRFHRGLFGYDSHEKVTVFLNDFSDHGNAGAGVLPRNMVHLVMAPVSFVYETYAPNERIFTLLNHELVHVVAFDQASATDRFFRGLFRGKVAILAEHPETILYSYLTAPRTDAARWYHEGAAVFVETWMAGGRGRAQGAYDEMVFRSMVRDGSRFYDPLGLASEGTKIDFQLDVNSYLYGTRFVSYLADSYGPDSIIRWFARKDGTSGYYSSQFERVYGRSLDSVWREWIAWERAFQSANLDSVRKYPITPCRDISDRGLGSVSRAYVDREEGKVYAALNYPGVVAHVAAISLVDGSIERLVEVKDPAMYLVTSLAFDPSSRTLFYTTDNYAWRDLRAIDLGTRKTRTLLKDARIGDLAFCAADSSLWGIRHYNGRTTLVRIPHPYTAWQDVFSWPYGQVVYDLDVSPDGSLVSASRAEISGRQTLRVMETERLLRGDTTAVAAYDFGNTIPCNFVFAGDGRRLFGSSYYTGVSNIFRFDLEDGAMHAVSNTETGFFRPVPVDGDSLVVFRYTGAGFVPAFVEARPIEDAGAITFLGQTIAEKYPEVRSWTTGSPMSVNLDSLVTHRGPYDSWSNIRLMSVYPVTEAYKDYPAYGLRLNLSDHLPFNEFGISASYSPNRRLPPKERVHLQAEYSRYNFGAAFKLNDADFYDLFGPTKVGRKGYSLGLNYKRNLVYDLPRRVDLDLGVTGYAGLDRLPDYQNVNASYDELVAAHARLSYENKRFSLGAVDAEKGLAWSLTAGDNFVNHRSVASGLGTLDAGVPLPVGHASFWLRTAAGYSPGDREDPFANFYFGGFGNNWIDHQNPKRYREAASFPGVELNRLGGADFVKVMAELNVPPLRFRRVGRPALFATWARLSLFTTGLYTNLGDAGRRTRAANVGSQVDVRLTLLTRLDMTLSLGYATAFPETRRRSEEFMVSLKIL